MSKKNTKYIFVTGGVTSSLGKGIVSASLGLLLKSRGFKVTIQKLDPYINIDPGTLNPYEHGECYVTEDGAETDLDLGHYERFTDENLTKNYDTVLISTSLPPNIYKAIAMSIVQVVLGFISLIKGGLIIGQLVAYFIGNRKLYLPVRKYFNKVNLNNIKYFISICDNNTYGIFMDKVR